MKRTIILATALGLLLATSAFAQTVVGSKHDLSTYITGTPAQVCVFCHTPHNSSAVAPYVTNAPLWNKAVPTTASYQVYTSQTMNATPVAITNVAYSESLLCLSCHDGTIALENMLNPPNGVTVAAIGTMPGSANLGTNLANDHPVNFTYADSIANGDAELVATPPAGYLSGGTVQCSSCHDPHVPGPDAPTLYFMRDTVDQSTLCTNCHQK